MFNEEDVTFSMKVSEDVVDVRVDEYGEFLICEFHCGGESEIALPISGLEVLAHVDTTVYFKDK